MEIRKLLGKVKEELKNTGLGKGIARNLKVFSLISLVLLAIAMSTTDITDNSITTPIVTVTTGDINNLTSEYAAISNLSFGSIPREIYPDNPSRPLTSNGDVNITVCAAGCDYTTIQEAINQVPYLLRHTYQILISDGTYSENVYVPPTVCARSRGDDEGSVICLRIRGNTTDMNAVKLTSIQISGNIGANNPKIEYMQITGVEADSDENCSIAVYASSQPELFRLNITGDVNKAILLYSSSASVDEVWFNNQVTGISLKRESMVNAGDIIDVSPAGGLLGEVSDAIIGMESGFGSLVGINMTSYARKVACGVKGGIVMEGTKAYCVSEFQNEITNITVANLTVDCKSGTECLTMLRSGGYDEMAGMYVDDSYLQFISTQDEIDGGGFQFNLGHNVQSGRSFEVLNNDSTVLFEVEASNGSVKILPTGGTTDTSTLGFNANRFRVEFNGTTGRGTLETTAGRGIDIVPGGYTTLQIHQFGYIQLYQNNSAITCTGSTAGAIYYGVDNSSYLCNGSEFRPITQDYMVNNGSCTIITGSTSTLEVC